MKPKILPCGYPIPISPGVIPTLLGLPWIWRQQSRPKHWYAYTSINWIMPKKNGNVSIDVRTSDLATLDFLLRSNAVAWEGEGCVRTSKKTNKILFSDTSLAIRLGWFCSRSGSVGGKYFTVSKRVRTETFQLPSHIIDPALACSSLLKRGTAA
jgi:hypothetical protein